MTHLATNSTERLPDHMLTPEEAAAYLGIKVQTLAAWRTGRGPTLHFVKVGRSVRYLWRDLVAFRDRHRVSSTACEN